MQGAAVSHRRSGGRAVVALVLGLLACCRAAPSTGDAPAAVDLGSIATIVVRHADGTLAPGAEVALATAGDWTQLAPVRGRTDAEGRVVLRCAAPCLVQAWSRQPPEVWQEPHIDFQTYVVPGCVTTLRLTPVAFAALAVSPATPSYATLLGYGALVPMLPGLRSANRGDAGGWQFTVARAAAEVSAPLEVHVAAAGRVTTTVALTPQPAEDTAPVVVDLAALAPRPWAAPRLEVALPGGELLGAAATELVRRAIWLYDEAAGEVFFPAAVRHGVPGHLHVPAGHFVVRANLRGEVTECWRGPIAADTATLRLVLPEDLRPVEVVLRGLLAWPVNLTLHVQGTTVRVGDAPSTLFGLDGRTVGDVTGDAATTRLVVLVPPGDLLIGLQEANLPHRPIGVAKALRVEAAPAAPPACVGLDVRP